MNCCCSRAAAAVMSSLRPPDTEGSFIPDDSCLIFFNLDDEPEGLLDFLSKLDMYSDPGLEDFDGFLLERGASGMSSNEFVGSDSSRIFLGFLLLRKFRAHIDRSL